MRTMFMRFTQSRTYRRCIGCQHRTIVQKYSVLLEPGWVGLLAHTPGTVRHGVGYPQWSHRSYVLEVEDDVLDLFLFTGEPAKILDSYAALTGRAAIPPLWSYGMWLSRAYYKVPQEAIDTAAELRRRSIPCASSHSTVAPHGRCARGSRLSGTRVDLTTRKKRCPRCARSISKFVFGNIRMCRFTTRCLRNLRPRAGC